MVFRFLAPSLLIFLVFEFSLMPACSPGSMVREEAGMDKVQSRLKEGQIAKISGTDLTIEVKKVTDFTSEGCLGGAVGCSDHVQLQVTLGKESREITLYFAHTGVQKEQGINRADIFGYRIVLMALKGKEAIFSIEKTK